MLVHVIVVIAGMALFQLSVPERSTIEPNDGNSLWLTPNRYLACAIGYLIGMGDFTLTMARVIICQVAVPKNRNEVFSLTRIYQSPCVHSWHMRQRRQHAARMLAQIGVARS
ncbi:unnamed protein product [Strongylus vulgaris]|uniref:Uncharacterized protein n=1 Tax=Strongylus vulgaris TaxID=40348 RepID=A0A3P7KSV3_STRVU|nr:unnamed protein product [Strongylus vulgaris]